MSTVKEGVGVGCKWTLAKMFEHLKSENVDVDRLWQRIIDIAILTVLPAVNEIPSSPQCFELFGFDVLLDDQMRP